MKLLILLAAFMTSLYVNAGPHTMQRGETFADVAKLYNLPLDSVIKANPHTTAYVGLTIEVPLSTLVFDLGNSELFRNLRYRIERNDEKGNKKFKAAYEKQFGLSKLPEHKRQKTESLIIEDYMEAVSYGNIDALYQLGRRKLHGVFYTDDIYLDFNQKVNSDIHEFKKGIEYLQIAALIGKNSGALIGLALACGYKDSPIYNPYLCLGMLEQYQKELGLNVNHLICYMYEHGYGVRTNLLKAYTYCGSTELTADSGLKTHREKILEKIEAMPANFESSRYGVGLDSNTMISIGLSHYHDEILEPEGMFWLHRAARQNNADANWILAGILQNNKYANGTMGNSKNKESQMLSFLKSAAANGKKEAGEYLEVYEKQQRIKAKEKRRRALEHQMRLEEKKQRRRQMWANIAGAVIQTAAQTYVAVESAKLHSRQMQGTNFYSTPQMSFGQMSDSQWQARNQQALQQIAQYTVNKTYADWTGTPMIPTDMSAVDLGTDMSPGSPLWNWGMQQQINTMATWNARMGCEISAFYKRQADQITQQLIENPLQPIAGYVDIDGNWISSDLIDSNQNNVNSTRASTSGGTCHGGDDIRSRNKAYYAERYGNIDCPVCHGNGLCPTCNGKRYNNNEFGVKGSHDCPNCLIENGRASGKCRQCQGKGVVYGLK